MSDSRGFMTVAAGERRYLEMAVDLALSLREFNAEPVALALGDELRRVASASDLAVFDHVVPLPPGYPKFLSKLAAPYVTPFDRTFFIDADSLAIGPLDGIWEPLAPTEFAVQGRYRRPDEDHDHHMLSTAALAKSFGLDRYLQHNSGVLYFRKAKAIAVAEACMDLWEKGFGRQLPFDEPLRAIVGGALGLTTIPKPLPMAWWPALVAPHETSFRLVHFMGIVRADTFTWLLRDVRRRREAAGLAWRNAIVTWLGKATRGRHVWTPDKFPHLAYRGDAVAAVA